MAIAAGPSLWSQSDGGIFIRGIVRDSLSTEGLPYSSIRVDGSKVSTVADSRGLFELTIPHNAKTITATCQGYAAATIPVK